MSGFSCSRNLNSPEAGSVDFSSDVSCFLVLAPVWEQENKQFPADTPWSNPRPTVNSDNSVSSQGEIPGTLPVPHVRVRGYSVTSNVTVTRNVNMLNILNKLLIETVTSYG